MARTLGTAKTKVRKRHLQAVADPKKRVALHSFAQKTVHPRLSGVFVPGKPITSAKAVSETKAKAVMNGVYYDAVILIPSTPDDYSPEKLPFWSALSENAQRFLKEEIPHCQANGLCVYCYPTGKKMKALPGKAFCYHHKTGAKGFKVPASYVEVLLHSKREKLGAILSASHDITSEEGLLLRRRIHTELRATEDELLEIRRFLEGKCIHCGKDMPPLDRGIENNHLTPGRKPTFFCPPETLVSRPGMKRRRLKSKCELQHHRERSGRKKPEEAHPKAIRAVERLKGIVEEQWNKAIGQKVHPRPSR